MVRLCLYIICLYFLASCASDKAPAEDKIDKLVVKDGYQLNYNLAYGDERYQFIVELQQMGPERIFSFDMTNKRGTDGWVTISEKGLDSARRQVNTFGESEAKFGDDEITVWVSRAVMSELLEKDSVSFNPGGFMTRRTMFYNKGKKLYEYELNGVPQKIEIIEAESEGGKYSFWLLNDRVNPLIIRMDVGWVIWLKEVNFN